MRKCNYLLICAATYFALFAVAFAEENDSPFELTAYPVAGELRILSRVWSSQGGLIGANASLTSTMDGDRRLVQYHVNNGRLEVLHDNLYRQPTNQLLRLLLGNGQVLVYERHPGFSLSDDPRTNRSYLVIDSSSGETRDVTPANMLDTPEWKKVAGPRTLWSEEYGLALFYYDPETREIILWQGKEQASEVNRTPPILAKGMTYIDGRLTYAYLTDDGTVLFYDWNTGRFEKSPVHGAIGIELAKVIGVGTNRPKGFSLANGIAIFTTLDPRGFAIIDVNGRRLDIERTPSDDMTQQEFLESLPKAMTEEEKITLASDWLLGIEKDKGFSQPADEVSSTTRSMPVDDTHVGLLDISYQRLILIGTAD